VPRTEEVYQQIRDERREQILRSAAEVFARKGVASTRINDLAEAAGVSQGLLYRYFANREEVFAALLERLVQETIRQVHSALEYPGTPWEQLHWLTGQLLLGMYERPNFIPLFSQAPAVSGKVPGMLSELGRAFSTVLRQLIVAGQTAGQVVERDPEQLVLLYLCCLQGLAAGMTFYGENLVAHFPDADAVLQLFKP